MALPCAQRDVCAIALALVLLLLRSSCLKRGKYWSAAYCNVVLNCPEVRYVLSAHRRTLFLSTLSTPRDAKGSSRQRLLDPLAFEAVTSMY
jgi:hypothetical protein